MRNDSRSSLKRWEPAFCPLGLMDRGFSRDICQMNNNSRMSLSSQFSCITFSSIDYFFVFSRHFIWITKHFITLKCRLYIQLIRPAFTTEGTIAIPPNHNKKQKNSVLVPVDLPICNYLNTWNGPIVWVGVFRHPELTSECSTQE